MQCSSLNPDKPRKESGIFDKRDKPEKKKVPHHESTKKGDSLVL